MIDKLTKDLITKVIQELNKHENKKKIEIEILNPLFTTYLYPYIFLLFIMFILLILFNLIIITIIYYKKNI
jgi:hypothetical protein